MNLHHITSILFISVTLAFADEPPKWFTASDNDPALISALAMSRQITAETKRLGFANAPVFKAPPLKSLFYAEYGRLENVKSFDIPCEKGSPIGTPPDFSIELPANGGRVYSYVSLGKRTPQAKPYTATLTKIEALSRCKAFVDLLLNGLVLVVKPGEIEFRQDVNYKYADTPHVGAYWTVSFQRYTSHDVPVLGDHVLVKIDENYGLRCFVNDCQAELRLPADEKPRVTSEEATKLAIPLSLRLKKDAPAFSAFYGGHELDPKPAAVELLVVRPNDMLTCTDLHDLKQETYGSLVWAVTFRLTDPEKKMLPAPLSVFIDAVTGKCVGGR